MQYFLQRADLISIADRSFWLRDYALLSNMQEGEISPEITNHYEGINIFISRQPNKRIPIEDFFIDFEYLITKCKIKTPINREAGRPFAFEVAKFFYESVSEMIREFSTERLINDDEEDEIVKNGLQRGTLYRVFCNLVHDTYRCYLQKVTMGPSY